MPWPSKNPKTATQERWVLVQFKDLKCAVINEHKVKRHPNGDCSAKFRGASYSVNILGCGDKVKMHLMQSTTVQNLLDGKQQLDLSVDEPVHELNATIIENLVSCPEFSAIDDVITSDSAHFRKNRLDDNLCISSATNNPVSSPELSPINHDKNDSLDARDIELGDNLCISSATNNPVSPPEFSHINHDQNNSIDVMDIEFGYNLPTSTTENPVVSSKFNTMICEENEPFSSDSNNDKDYVPSDADSSDDANSTFSEFCVQQKSNTRISSFTSSSSVTRNHGIEQCSPSESVSYFSSLASPQNVCPDAEPSTSSAIFSKSSSLATRSTYDSFVTYMPNRTALPEHVAISGLKEQKKHFFCLFCKKHVTRFARHMSLVHKNLKDVQEFLSLPKKSLNRQKIIEKLRKAAAFEYNVKSEYNEGDLIVTRRPNASFKRKATDYLPCINCKGFYRNENLSVHFKHCSNEKLTSVKKLSRIMFEPSTPVAHQVVLRLLRSGRPDMITNAIKEDQLIMSYGNRLCLKHANTFHLDSFIRSKMRQICRFVLETKTLDPSIRNLADCIDPAKFDTCIEAINNVSGWNPDTRCYKVPSLAVAIGTTLVQCANILTGQCIKQSNDPGSEELKKRVNDFLKIMKLDYGNVVSRVAVGNLEEGKWNRPKLIPMAEDVQKFSQYLKTKAESSYNTLMNNGFTYYQWSILASSTLVLILVFNRRRTGETERITLEQYNLRSGISPNSDVYKTLNTYEKALCKKFKRIELRGKLGRRVSVLLNSAHVKYIGKMIEHRKDAGVENTNRYLFGIGSTSHFSAVKSVRDAAYACGAKCPQLLRGTNLRKQIATITQVIEMTENDLEILAQFMGHSHLIHKEHYRKEESTLQIARISKLLMTFDDGKIDEVRGKTLDEINVDCFVDESSLELEDTFEPETECEENDVQLQSISKASAPTGCTPIPFASNSEHVSDSTETSFVPKKSKATKKKCSGKGKDLKNKFIARRTWRTPEKQAVKALFENNLREGILPGYNKCHEVVAKYSPLKTRTAEQLYAYINNNIKKKK